MGFTALIGGLALMVSGLVIASRVVAEPVAATAYAVLVAALVAAGALLRTYQRVGAGWVRWRRSVAALAVIAMSYPGAWAIAVISSEVLPNTFATWFLAVLAGVAHLPVIAAFSLLPLLAVRYLGRGSTRMPLAVVLLLGAMAIVTFALFFGEFEPIRADALVGWALGETIGMAINALFLASVLLGPLSAVVAAARTDGEAGRRLAIVAASALSGAALVMLCGAAGAVAGFGGIAVVLGMYAALVVVVVGCTRALTVPMAPSEQPTPSPPPARRLEGLTPREAEVLGLLAEGLSNAGVAARLVLSQRTVDAHLRSVFTKLDLPEGPLDNRRVHAVLAWRSEQQDSQSAS